ncbi:hypothetical protein [Secundilactobacillus kimchicus]|uniref:hypothetical protein n=1 Tax=Secundilactobacillus kimchicus TaxID=528209 RepID=UPI0024A8869A|nr:hypothetical protein [Secundilactobacillus kimchicus]
MTNSKKLPSIREHKALFRADTQSNIDKFLKGGFNPSREDGVWAGQGLYFWDNLSNAKYWLQNRTNKHPEIKYGLTMAELEVNHNQILDLTDDDESKKLKIIAQKYAHLDDMNLNLNENGTVINYVYDRLKHDGKAVFLVVKIHGSYPKKHSNGIIGMNEVKYVKSPHATAKVRTIYAVREPQVLIRRFSIDPTKEEISDEFPF